MLRQAVSRAALATRTSLPFTRNSSSRSLQLLLRGCPQITSSYPVASQVIFLHGHKEEVKKIIDKLVEKSFVLPVAATMPIDTREYRTEGQLKSLFKGQALYDAFKLGGAFDFGPELTKKLIDSIGDELYMQLMIELNRAENLSSGWDWFWRADVRSSLNLAGKIYMDEKSHREVLAKFDGFGTFTRKKVLGDNDLLELNVNVTVQVIYIDKENMNTIEADPKFRSLIEVSDPLDQLMS